MSNKVTRRELIQQATLVGGMAALGGVWTEGIARASRRPGDKLRIASIGVGGQGASDLAQMSSEIIVALCDVDERRAADSFKKHPESKKYADFRKMLEQEEKNIDAVVVSTPDHFHAPAAVMAMKLGKHVYCQKPLAHSVSEARAMLEAARKHKVVTQMGTQGHPSYARTVELIQAGAIGPVHAVHVITDRPAGWWPQGVDRPTEAQPVPPGLDWDLWLGPAAERPYNSAYLPFVWRGWWDFGTGALGDMGCHLFDGPWWALKLTAPTTVEAQGDPIKPDSGPLWSVITYEFPARADMPPVTLTWYDGGKRPPTDVTTGITILREDAKGKSQVPIDDVKDFNGSIFVGAKGRLLSPHGGGPRVFPEELEKASGGTPQTIDRGPGHYRQWIEACKTGGATGSNFEYAVPLTEAVLLGNVALRTGKKLEWDSRRMRATNIPEADQFIRYHFRKGWTL